MKVYGPGELLSLLHQQDVTSKSSSSSCIPPNSSARLKGTTTTTYIPKDYDSDIDSNHAKPTTAPRKSNLQLPKQFKEVQSQRLKESLAPSSLSSWCLLLPKTRSSVFSVPTIFIVTFTLLLYLVVSSSGAQTEGDFPREGEAAAINYPQHAEINESPTTRVNNNKEKGNNNDNNDGRKTQVGKNQTLKNPTSESSQGKETKSEDQQRHHKHQGRNYFYDRGTTSSIKDDENSSSLFPFPTYYAAYIANAVESGVREANNLYETVEPDLYRKDLVIKGDHPAFYLAAINRQSPKAKELAKYAYATLKATSVLKEQLAQLRDERDHPISEISLSGAPFHNLQRSMCPSKRQIEESCPPSTLRWRKVDGMCNNLKQIHMGSSFQPFARYLPPEYDDGVSTIRKSTSGKQLPSARKISTTIHKDVSNPSSTFTLMVMQFGQLVDHDLTATSQTRAFNHSIPRCCNVPERHPDCLAIEIPDDDPHFNGTDKCMEFIRSSPAPRTDCTLGPREQLNQLTSWLDGSVVYGSTDSDLQALRMYTKGHLRYSHMSGRKSLLPRLVHPPEDDCVLSSPRLFCFAAGDGRVNEQPGLTTMHTVWMRQHNAVADRLSEINPHWEEERLFQETRKIIIAQLQFITYREFLPLVLGPDVIKVFGLRLLKTGYYAGYNETIDATIPSVFAAAAFRFGHSLVQPNINRCDEHHREMPYNVELSQEMMSPMNIHNFGEVDRISLGLVSQKSQRRDEFITTQLTNHLFKTRFHPGLDLAAINIQRGRDHGLPPYLKWRDACGLNNKALPNNKSVIVDWEDFSIATEIPPEKVQLFSQIYEDPWDVDLFPGAMIEYPVKGGLLGPTFSCIIAQTFRNLRRGDRFWFENPTVFTDAQLRAIRNITLARVMCDTSDAIKTIQPIVFLVPQDQKNAHENCTEGKKIPIIDYSAWKEEPFSEAALNVLREGGIFPNQPFEEPTFYPPIEASSTTSSSSTPEVTTDYFANLPPYLLKKFQTLFS